MNLNINLTDYEEQQEFTLLPDGFYNVRITDAEVKESRAGNPMVKVEMEIFGEKYQGRKLWQNFVLNNDKALNMLKGFAIACGVKDNLTDPNDLINCELKVKVKIQPPQNGYDESNKIASWKPNTTSTKSTGTPNWN